MEFEFRKLDINGVKTLVQWANDEGWNPAPNDAEAFYATDPDGFYGYFDSDKMIGGGSIVSYNGEFGFMGFFIIQPKYRSKGLGRELWYHRRDKLLSRLNTGAAIGMDGVLAMQPFYEKGGFSIAFRDERHKITGRPFDIDNYISNIESDDFSAIHEYDKTCFGFDRTTFLKSWLSMPNIKTFKYIQDGILKGYAIIRKANTGYKICPLFADNAAIADELYKACMNEAKDEQLYIDIPMTNNHAVALVKKYNCEYVFECARMYYGNARNMSIDKVYGITTFELG